MRRQFTSGPNLSGMATVSCRAIISRRATVSRSTHRRVRWSMWRATIDELGTLTPYLNILGMMATGTISAGLAFIAATTMAAPLVRDGREHLSDRSGIAADPPLS